jgi:predicted nucleic acid-binding protein
MDLLALALARQEQCPLLTGDRNLRQVAKEVGVEVNGTIWLVGEMLGAKVVTRTQAADAYDAMHREGRRLPKDEIEAQLKRY